MTECNDWMQKTLVQGEVVKRDRLNKELEEKQARIKLHFDAIVKKTGISPDLLKFVRRKEGDSVFYIFEACGLHFYSTKEFWSLGEDPLVYIRKP